MTMNEVQQQVQTLCERGWSIPAIARAIGMSDSAVEKWRAGNRTPGLRNCLPPRSRTEAHPEAPGVNGLPNSSATARRLAVDDQDLYTIVITTYIPPRQVGDGPWTPWYADYYHPEV